MLSPACRYINERKYILLSPYSYVYIYIYVLIIYMASSLGAAMGWGENARCRLFCSEVQLIPQKDKTKKGATGRPRRTWFRIQHLSSARPPIFRRNTESNSKTVASVPSSLS